MQPVPIASDVIFNSGVENGVNLTKQGDRVHAQAHAELV